MCCGTSAIKFTLAGTRNGGAYLLHCGYIGSISLSTVVLNSRDW